MLILIVNWSAFNIQTTCLEWSFTLTSRFTQVWLYNFFNGPIFRNQQRNDNAAIWICQTAKLNALIFIIIMTRSNIHGNCLPMYYYCNTRYGHLKNLTGQERKRVFFFICPVTGYYWLFPGKISYWFCHYTVLEGISSTVDCTLKYNVTSGVISRPLVQFCILCCGLFSKH